jgi:hypothetical protein
MQDDELQDIGKATKFEVPLINYRKIVEEEMTQTFYAHMNKRTLKKKRKEISKQKIAEEKNHRPPRKTVSSFKFFYVNFPL